MSLWIVKCRSRSLRGSAGVHLVAFTREMFVRSGGSKHCGRCLSRRSRPPREERSLGADAGNSKKSGAKKSKVEDLKV